MGLMVSLLGLGLGGVAYLLELVEELGLVE